MSRSALRQGLGILMGACAALAAMPSHAVTVTLVDVQIYTGRASPFGMLFDGSDIWYGNLGGNTIHKLKQANTVNSAADTSLLLGGSVGALAFDGTHFLGANSSRQILSFNSNGTIASTLTLPAGTQSKLSADGQFGLVDGLDFDHNQFFYSPDIGRVYHLDSAGNLIEPNAILNFGGFAGNISGVERVDVGANSFLIVVNDAVEPRQLCVHQNAAGFAQIGCTTIPNSRFEDLAFDGRFLWGADLNGSAIHKIDLLVDGGSIFVPPVNGVPEPATLALLGLGLAGIGALRRRKTKA